MERYVTLIANGHVNLAEQLNDPQWSDYKVISITSIVNPPFGIIYTVVLDCHK